MKILIFDNYDSFTYNLVHQLRDLGYENLEVHRNNKIELKKIEKFDKILISPGPGIPKEAGIMLQLIEYYASKKSILGICLGHQGICEVFGGKLWNMAKVAHGLSLPTKIISKEERLFYGLPKEFLTGRYHSWSVVKDSLPHELKVTALSQDGEVMAVSHQKYDVKGLQFHPESILTDYGKNILSNWLQEK